jgi:hypothetical protein
MDIVARCAVTGSTKAAARSSAHVAGQRGRLRLRHVDARDPQGQCAAGASAIYGAINLTGQLLSRSRPAHRLAAVGLRNLPLEPPPGHAGNRIWNGVASSRPFDLHFIFSASSR